MMRVRNRDLRLRLADRIVEPAAVERLVIYVELLERWAARHSLVRFKSREELLRRHIFESLEGRKLMADKGVLADLGSGAGLPGIPLLACQPGWSGTLVEPRQKRWAFLRLVIRELELNARAECLRFQDLAEDLSFDLVTVRALRIEETMLEFAVNHLNPGGRLLLWSTDEEEARTRRLDGWRVVSSALPDLDRGCLIEMEPCFT